MTSRVTINCDMGEGMPNDAALMPFIDAANIACGYHAGDPSVIRETINLAKQHDVSIGAHISFPDKANFGRTVMQLPADELYDLVIQQLFLFKEIADSLDQKINHVKPHGALYNLSAEDPVTANIIAKAVRDFDNQLILYGLSGSHSIEQAKAAGLRTASEVFADRTYRDDGSLTSRSEPGAMIGDERSVVERVRQLIGEQTVTAVSGRIIPVKAETVCIHGDGPHALVFARAIYESTRNE